MRKNSIIINDKSIIRNNYLRVKSSNTFNQIQIIKKLNKKKHFLRNKISNTLKNFYLKLFRITKIKLHYYFWI